MGWNLAPSIHGKNRLLSCEWRSLLCPEPHFFVEGQKYTIPYTCLKRKNTGSMKITLFYFSNFIFRVLCLQSSADNSLNGLGNVDQESYVEGKKKSNQMSWFTSCRSQLALCRMPVNSVLLFFKWCLSPMKINQKCLSTLQKSTMWSRTRNWSESITSIKCCSVPLLMAVFEKQPLSNT